MELRELVPALFSSDLEWMNDKIVELAIPAGTLVQGERRGDVTLRGDVYAPARREEMGSWIYIHGDERVRVAGGCAQDCGPVQ